MKRNPGAFTLPDHADKLLDVGFSVKGLVSAAHTDITPKEAPHSERTSIAAKKNWGNRVAVAVVNEIAAVARYPARYVTEE